MQLKAGDSVAVNGCCLTVEKIRARGRTSCCNSRCWPRVGSGPTSNSPARVPASIWNGPCAWAAALGGHFVAGHIDGLGKITRWEQAGRDYILEISAPRDIMRYIVFKGSVAVDGISLTVAAVRRKSFEIWIIPHTRQVTALQERKVGRRRQPGNGPGRQIRRTICY